MTLGRACLVHPEHDDPVPIEDHHVRPLPRGGRGSAVRVCANAHGRIHALLDDIEDRAAVSPYATVDEILRHLPTETWAGYTVIERAVAYRGWQAYGLGFLNGRYADAYRMWRTDGTPKHPDVPMYADLLHAARWSKKWRRELGAM